MLRALELTGFKSFADKTRFDFPAGITVVVGPNGSGKSNIVDAIKWVLGEQSAKSLRGKEMADVIFKGSGGGLRRPSNTAEATIVFDNSNGQLALEAPEVHVTRRVYRSGEGEYLINRQACRLRDVRDLFRGTGVGSDAYSLIEQGKVDTLLQASPRDRRAIFEEAAGISRFKAKKVEAQRRLERVDQNLLRLWDIVEEVDRRLRTVRSQATKARRYKEYTARLQQLRTHVGRVDWQRLTEKLSAMQAQLTQLEQESAALSAQQEAVEARALELEAEGTLSGEQLRTCEARTARIRERIATCESSREHEQRRLADLDDEVARQRLRVAALSTKAGDLHEQLRETTQSLNAAEEQYQRVEQEHLQQETTLQGLDEQLGQLRRQTETDRAKYLSQMRASAALGNQISAAESRRTTADAAIQRHTHALAELAAAYEAADAELLQFQSDEARLEQAVQLSSAALEELQSVLQRSRRHLAERLDELANSRGQRAGAQQRAAVLEECESRLEGISAGVKHVLARARDESTGPFSDVRGLVADLIEVHVEMAPLVDVALGDRSQFVVVAGNGLLAHLESGQCRIAGRVCFLPVGSPPNARDVRRGIFAGQPGVIGCADQFIQTQSEFQPLLTRLLGDTWFVETLADAFRLRQTAFASGLRFVTRAGEMIDGDGGILVGPRHAAVGLVSRRSQLRALRDEIIQWDSRIDELERESAELRETIDKQDRQLLDLTRRHEEASSAWSAHRARADAAGRRHEELGQRISAAEAELDTAHRQLAGASEELAAKQSEREQLESLLAELDARILRSDQKTLESETQRHGILREATATKVELAKSEQRLEGLRTQMAQFQRDQEERSKTLSETRTGLQEVQQRHTSAQRAILAATSALAGLYLDVESLLRESAALVKRREDMGLEKSKTGGQLQQLRVRLRENEDQQHRKQLDAGEIRHQRSALAERLRDDYQIDLSDLEDEPADDLHHEREEVDAEIDQLRRKINNIGPVNMDALAELDQLEQRYESLSTQYRDLVDAKESLERIIQKINADSRRLFSETLEAIRANFQTMFRKVFGGGNADIVLEDNVDLLESGIDILATPPGKQPLGLSLLSGGERALTAVTLLLAVFQYRPSPFCVLDEVDGPLDEANIGRFIDVLREFLDWTKFVVVTHSKKTMTAATTLYGITMQESGVSKRVSVQFDDVNEDGHIRQEALQRDIVAAAASDEDERGAA